MDLFDDTYRIIDSPAEGLFKDRGSKFISHVFAVENEDEVKMHLEQLRKKYYDARHHCYAYIIGPDKATFRINDDGEPSGSAGKPIHGQLLSHDLTNILVVVIRYFGGTKLGIPGLINAYREATKDALSKCRIKELTVNKTYTIQYDYPLMDVVMRFMKDHQLTILDTRFEMDCQVKFEVRLSQEEKILDLLNKIYGVSFVKD